MASVTLWFVCLFSCSRSVLIARDDATYRRAIARYRQTRELVAASLAPDDEQAMFLQAEGLFRYRFAPPERSAQSWLAVAGAAIVELPALDSLSGALDLWSLRLKTYDGAIQLWESLLVHSPKTPLRTLALYRLGWAYRNAIAEGFPRDSDAAFGEAAKQSGDPLAPIAAAARDVPYKSQGRATAWSLLPGLGQMYVGDYGGGAWRLALALASTAATIVPGVIAYENRNELSWSHDWPLLAISFTGATVLAYDYSSSYDDALRSVLEYNEAREREFEDAHPEAP